MVAGSWYVMELVRDGAGTEAVVLGQAFPLLLSLPQMKPAVKPQFACCHGAVLSERFNQS